MHTKCQFTCQVALQSVHLYSSSNKIHKIIKIFIFQSPEISLILHLWNFFLILSLNNIQTIEHALLKCSKTKFHGFPIENLHQRRWKIAHFILKQLLIGPPCVKSSDLPYGFILQKLCMVLVNTFKITVVFSYYIQAVQHSNQGNLV